MTDLDRVMDTNDLRNEANARRGFLGIDTGYWHDGSIRDRLLWAADTIDTLRQQIAEAQARIAALEAENAALRARLAAGVDVELSLWPSSEHWPLRAELEPDEYAALLPLDGKRVIVVEATDNALHQKEAK